MNDVPPVGQSSELSYLSPVQAPSAFGSAAWLSLLVMGIFELLGAFCGTAGLVVAIVNPGVIQALPRSPATLHRTLLLWSILYVALPLAASITKIVCAVKVRRGSVSAFVAAGIVLSAEICGLTCAVAIAVRNIMMRRVILKPEMSSAVVLIGIVIGALILNLCVLIRAWIKVRKNNYLT